MQSHSSSKSPFSLTFKSGNHHNILHVIKEPLERVLSLKSCEKIYSTLPDHKNPLSFMQSLLSALNVRTMVTDSQISNIPPEGPAVVIANHPFGAIEGIILAKILCTIRPDVKVMANFLLSRIPQLKELFIPVDPFDGASAVRGNIRPMRDAVRWVRGGHLLVVFPAGEVSHFKPAQQEISDPGWSPGVVKIIRKTEAPVLPVFFKGVNSTFFQLAGLLHPKIRTAMLAREFVNKRRKTIELKIGKLIPYNRLDRKPIEDPRPVDVLSGEVDRLPIDQQLAVSGDYVVWHAEAWQIPCLLQEIGRLREISF